MRAALTKKIKAQLIKCMSVSETAKLNHLLTDLMLGDRAVLSCYKAHRTSWYLGSLGKIHEVHVRRVVAEISRGTLIQVAQLQQMVAALIATVSELEEAVLRSGRSTRSRSRSTGSRSSGPSLSTDTCIIIRSPKRLRNVPTLANFHQKN